MRTRAGSLRWRSSTSQSDRDSKKEIDVDRSLAGVEVSMDIYTTKPMYTGCTLHSSSERMKHCPQCFMLYPHSLMDLIHRDHISLPRNEKDRLFHVTIVLTSRHAANNPDLSEQPVTPRAPELIIIYVRSYSIGINQIVAKARKFYLSDTYIFIIVCFYF